MRRILHAHRLYASPYFENDDGYARARIKALASHSGYGPRNFTSITTSSGPISGTGFTPSHAKHACRNSPNDASNVMRRPPFVRAPRRPIRRSGRTRCARTSSSRTPAKGPTDASAHRFLARPGYLSAVMRLRRACGSSIGYATHASAYGTPLRDTRVAAAYDIACAACIPRRRISS